MTTEPPNARSEEAGGGPAGTAFNAPGPQGHSDAAAVAASPSASASASGPASGSASGSGSVSPPAPAEGGELRDIAEVPAVEVVTAAAVHLMSAAAVKCGLAQDVEPDLDEARKLITVLAALVTAAAPEIGGQHAAPLRDGLRTLQLAFREASVVPDPPGLGPGERWTGPVT